MFTDAFYHSDGGGITDFLNGKISLKTNSVSEFNDLFSMPTDPKVAEVLSAYEAGTFAGGGLI